MKEKKTEPNDIVEKKKVFFTVGSVHKSCKFMSFAEGETMDGKS